MAWVVVPALKEGSQQLDEAFPNREHGAEGFVGDTAHKGSPSSHNPDKTGNPEFSDGDNQDEVRAWDADKDLHDPNVTMEDVVQHLITGLRAGKFWWIRYIIFNGRIWHRRDNFVTRVYTGSNKHTDHMHVNSDFTQAADGASGTNWEFKSVKGGQGTAPAPSGPRTLQKGSNGDDVRKLQEAMRKAFPIYRNYVNTRRGQLLLVDGDFGDQTKAWVTEFQRRTGLLRDGVVGPNTRAKLGDYNIKF